MTDFEFPQRAKIFTSAQACRQQLTWRFDVVRSMRRRDWGTLPRRRFAQACRTALLYEPTMDEAARSEPTHLSERTDIELVGDVLLGSARAATELVRRHRLSMYRVALRLTHDAHDADDVTQEAFIQTFRKLRQFKQQCAFRTWLYRITVNTAFMALRRRRSVKESMLRHLELDGGTTNFDPPDTTGPASDEVAIVHQLADNMAKAMNALPEIHRTALILCTCEDLTGSEVAESLSTSELNVKMRLFRARAALRRSLASVEAG